MSEKLIVVGDIHLRENDPYFTQGKLFLDWLFTNHNESENSLLLLGDLVESINVSHELLEVYIDYFVNVSKFKKIYILQGNHDCTISSTLLSAFKPLKNVEVILEAKSLILGKVHALCLPHFDYTQSGVSMVDFYSNPDEDIKKIEFDFCFHHVEDETEHFSSKFCDLSTYRVKTFMAGHIHTETITKGGHYLGSPIFNSRSEQNKVPIIASIDLLSKEYSIIEVPIWLKYYDVEYPNVLPAIDTPLAVITVDDSLDREETIKFYKADLDKRVIPKIYYFRRINHKKTKLEEIALSSKKQDTKDLLTLFKEYASSNKISLEVKTVCDEVLNLFRGE
jgi:DNA repair exonuclease SbcCD nuclease subunit